LTDKPLRDDLNRLMELVVTRHVWGRDLAAEQMQEKLASVLDEGRVSYGLRDNGVVPLICPTRQMFSRYRSRHHANNYLLLCMGLFSIF
jgi:hypothetical protein